MQFDQNMLRDLIAHCEVLIPQLRDVLVKNKKLDEEALLARELNKFQQNWGNFMGNGGEENAVNADDEEAEQNGSSMARRNRQQKRRSSLMVFV